MKHSSGTSKFLGGTHVYQQYYLTRICIYCYNISDQHHYQEKQYMVCHKSNVQCSEMVLFADDINVLVIDKDKEVVQQKIN
jgi:hypothetical protein